MDQSSLLLRRIDAQRNMARYYALSIEPTLFGDVAVVRRWGRLGCHGRQIIEICADRAAACRAMERYAKAKRRRGYG